MYNTGFLASNKCICNLIRFSFFNFYICLTWNTIIFLKKLFASQLNLKVFHLLPLSHVLFYFLFFYKFVLLNTEAFTLTPCSFPYEKKFIFYGLRKKKPIFIQFPYILCEHFKYFSPSLINEPSLLYIYIYAYITARLTAEHFCS